MQVGEEGTEVWKAARTIRSVRPGCLRNLLQQHFLRSTIGVVNVSVKVKKETGSDCDSQSSSEGAVRSCTPLVISGVGEPDSGRGGGCGCWCEGEVCSGPWMVG